jgi:hypothetical protein
MTCTTFELVRSFQFHGLPYFACDTDIIWAFPKSPVKKPEERQLCSEDFEGSSAAVWYLFPRNVGAAIPHGGRMIGVV